MFQFQIPVKISYGAPSNHFFSFFSNKFSGYIVVPTQTKCLRNSHMPAGKLFCVNKNCATFRTYDKVHPAQIPESLGTDVQTADSIFEHIKTIPGSFL